VAASGVVATGVASSGLIGLVGGVAESIPLIGYAAERM
jgi:hypothetical protein